MLFGHRSGSAIFEQFTSVPKAGRTRIIFWGTLSFDRTIVLTRTHEIFARQVLNVGKRRATRRNHGYRARLEETRSKILDCLNRHVPVQFIDFSFNRVQKCLLYFILLYISFITLQVHTLSAFWVILTRGVFRILVFR